MDYNAVLNRVRPMLTNGNHLSAQGFDALFGSCSQQEQEHLLAELAGLGILVDTSAAIPSSRKATSFCRSDFTLQAALVYDQRAALRIGTAG